MSRDHEEYFSLLGDGAFIQENSTPPLSCSNYYCEGYIENSCQRALEHRLKLFEKRLDDNHIPKRNNTRWCDMRVIPKEK